MLNEKVNIFRPDRLRKMLAANKDWCSSREKFHAFIAESNLAATLVHDINPVQLFCDFEEFLAYVQSHPEESSAEKMFGHGGMWESQCEALTLAARRFLAAPLHVCSLERAWSLLGDIDHPKRTRMSTEQMRARLLASYNGVENKSI